MGMRQEFMRAAVVPFQLSVGGRGSAGYALRAVAAGRSAEAALELPPLPGAPEALGLALGRALFPAPVRQLLIDVARGADEAGARVQIQLEVAPPELANLPWELATLGRESPWRPAIREDYTLVRAGRVAPAPPLAVAGPLRLLIACAPGAADAAEPLGRALGPLVREGSLVVDLLRDADPLALREALAEEPCHLLHLVAADASGAASAARLLLGQRLDGAGLAGILAEAPALRFVTIATGPEADAAAVVDVAATVHGRLGLATVALGGLDAALAAAFSGPCYSAIAQGDPVDLAATDGRAALAGANGSWGAPCVWLAPGGEQLFALRPASGAVRAGSLPEQGDEPGPPLPVGTPLRPRQATSGRAARALATARAFVVATTTVGAPALRARLATPTGVARPKLIALGVALLVLAVMVSRVLPGEAPPPVDEVELTLEAAPAPASASIPRPRSYTTYVAQAGDTLAAIAERAGSDAEALAAVNALPPGTPLWPGRPLVVPLYSDGEALPPAQLIERANPARPAVALTFDINGDEAPVYAILDLLAERSAQATFFITGSWAEQYPQAVQAILAAGHEIGNLSQTHPAFSGLSAEGAIEEIARAEQAIASAAGRSPRPFFRFPYGDSTPELVELAARSGYLAAHWSADDYAAPAWLARAAADPAAAQGGILLLHARQATVEALPGYLDQLAAIGLTPTTLGEALR